MKVDVAQDVYALDSLQDVIVRAYVEMKNEPINVRAAAGSEIGDGRNGIVGV